MLLRPILILRVLDIYIYIYNNNNLFNFNFFNLIILSMLYRFIMFNQYILLLHGFFNDKYVLICN
jgi:hypothetical protein